jgi:hypothetical protein
MLPYSKCVPAPAHDCAMCRSFVLACSVTATMQRRRPIECGDALGAWLDLSLRATDRFFRTPVAKGKSRSMKPLLEHQFSGVKQKLAFTPLAFSTHACRPAFIPEQHSRATCLSMINVCATINAFAARAPSSASLFRQVLSRPRAALHRRLRTSALWPLESRRIRYPMSVCILFAEIWFKALGEMGRGVY